MAETPPANTETTQGGQATHVNDPPQVAQPTVEVDDDVETDSTYEPDGTASSTASLRSSILKFREENGRTYHAYKDGAYFYPNDEKENDRLDLQHHLFLLCLDGELGLAPPNKNPKGGRVLDVGTGTGIWAADYGDAHPNCHVIGVDLSPTQPATVPVNVTFEVDDVEENWTFSQPFEYIHSRLMTSSISDWKKYLRQCYDNLQPGGWLELQETGLPTSDDGTMHKDTFLYKSAEIMREGSIKIGKPFIDPWCMSLMLEQAGFVNVKQHRFHFANNTWPKDHKLKEIGAWNNLNLRGGLEAFLLAYGTRILGWNADEIRVLAAKGIQDGNDRRIHSYWPVGIAYGQKPESSN